jgi:homoserine kinase type II
MAAFTTFTEEALVRYLVMFGKGQLQEYVPITAGIENSNYFITLNQYEVSTDYVLTIIEDLSFDEVPFFNKILTQLYQYGLPVAAPQSTLDGMTLTIFCGKPAFLFPKLPGRHPVEIEATHCQKIGEFLAICHQSLSDVKVTRANPYDLDWMQASLNQVKSKITDEELDQLSSLVNEYEHLQGLDLPRGLIHGDLFKDNALFVGEGPTDVTLSGVIDFYHACDDFLIQDIAIAINDWCIAENGGINETLKSVLISGYEEIRPMTPGEEAALVPIQRTSAARFALTRLLSGDPPLKNPTEMLNLAARLR